MVIPDLPCVGCCHSLLKACWNPSAKPTILPSQASVTEEGREERTGRWPWAVLRKGEEKNWTEEEWEGTTTAEAGEGEGCTWLWWCDTTPDGQRILMATPLPKCRCHENECYEATCIIIKDRSISLYPPREYKWLQIGYSTLLCFLSALEIRSFTLYALSCQHM